MSENPTPQIGAASAPTEGWRNAPPPVVAQPAAAAPGRARDAAQRVGDVLYVGVALISRIPLGFIILIAGWGISVPAVLLRSNLNIVVRVLVSLALFVGWVGLIVSQA